ncbi:MAG: helix-hairpin-helix domain-containing protein, partial [Bacillota bacterium]|nr:helix-hairpin-helix domain-containing protein [Bacillota bacterium]
MPSSLEQVPLDGERLCWLALTRLPGIGGRRWKWLLERFGSARAIWEASPSALQKTPGIGPRLVEAILRARAEFDAPAEEERLRRLG